MNREELVLQAEKLPPASEATISEYGRKRERMVSRVNELMLERPDIEGLVGAGNIEMMKDNHSNHARYVEAVLATPNAAELVDTVCWVFRAYRSRGFHPNYWSAQLNTWVRVIQEEMSDAGSAETEPLYNWFLIHIPSFTALTDHATSGQTPSGPVRHD